MLHFNTINTIIMNPNYILLAIPFFLGSIVIEFLWGRFKNTKLYNFEDTITNLNIGIGSQAFSTFLKVVLLSIYEYIYIHYAPYKTGQSVMAFVLCLVIYDFIFYWAHRWGHEMNIFWAMHIVHHQSEEYNLSVALRQSWFHNMLAFVLFLPIPLLGFNPLIFGGASVFSTLYQYGLHTKYTKSFGFLDWVLNTPSHHRVHHATNPQYLDKNYAGVFIIWDRLFGTFEKEAEEPVYGITSPLKSWNPVWANFHFFNDIRKGAEKLGSVKDKFLLLFRGPNYLGSLIKDELPVQYTGTKYKTKVPLNMQLYVLLHFILLVTGLVFYMQHYAELTTFYKVTMFLLIMLSLMSCGAILENKKGIVIMELLRFAAFLSFYNTLYFYHYNDYILYTIAGSVLISLASMIWVVVNWLYRGKELPPTSSGGY